MNTYMPQWTDIFLSVLKSACLSLCVTL